MNETITINGVQYPMVFGWNAIRKFSDATKVNLMFIETALLTRMDYQLFAIHLAITEGCRKEKKDFDLSIDEFTDLFDQDPNALKTALGFIGKSLKMIVKSFGEETKKTAKSKNVKTPV